MLWLIIEYAAIKYVRGVMHNYYMTCCLVLRRCLLKYFGLKSYNVCNSQMVQEKKVYI